MNSCHTQANRQAEPIVLPGPSSHDAGIYGEYSPASDIEPHSGSDAGFDHIGTGSSQDVFNHIGTGSSQDVTNIGTGSSQDVNNISQENSQGDVEFGPWYSAAHDDIGDDPMV